MSPTGKSPLKQNTKKALKKKVVTAEDVLALQLLEKLGSVEEDTAFRELVKNSLSARFKSVPFPQLMPLNAVV